MLPETGASDERLVPFDEMMRCFLQEHPIPGAALAVAKDGRLIYARGFGFADVGRKQPVEPDALFRIASVSKPITALAILQLVEKGKLELEERVFDLLSDQYPLPEGEDVDPRLQEITIRNVLQHTGGWDRDESFDPMFRSVEFARQLGVEPPALQEHIIRAMATQKLDFAPGERAAYSNYGSCLLGRVIEARTGKPYEDSVRELVLEPAGIRRMRLGRTLPEGRCDGEVRYYTPDDATGPAVIGSEIGASVPHPYGAWCLEAMDAHGGWLASTVDLLRFAAAVDGTRPPRLLKESTLDLMLARPEGGAGKDEDGKPKETYYGCGWLVRPLENGKANTWHTGSLPGTAALLVCRHDGLAWAILFNSRATTNGEHAAREIDPLIHRAANAVREWPEHDLFEEFD
jgi:N-acyl-D-amino-acid deacylase